MENELKVTRNQLSSFIKDHNTLVQFEKLIRYMNTLIPADSSDTSIKADTNETNNNVMSSEIFEIKKSIEDLKQNVNINNLIDEISELKKKFEDLEQGPLIEKHNSIEGDYFDFTKSNPTIHRVGRLCWNLTEETLNIHHPDGVLQQVGQEQYIRFENNTLSTILNGTVLGLEVVGGVTTGNIVPYIADASIPLVYIVGVATQDIEPTKWGRLTTFGQVKDFDTTGVSVGESWILGDVLYSSPVSAGNFTNIKPTSPNWSIPVALVQNVDATNGIVFVRPTIEQELYYGVFTRNTDQSPALINTAYALLFDTTEISNGVVLDTSLSRIMVSQSGVYSIALTMHLESGNAAGKEFWTFFRVNGIIVPNSSIATTVIGAGAHVALTRSLFFTLSKNDYIEVMYASDSTNIKIDTDPSTVFAPAAPGCIITVEQIQQ
ncbi:MAG: hypothetical protein WBA74_10445 [Cyclobacteriaceae bacterium]